MDNQHRKIRGYKELTQEQIDLMNAIKFKGSELGELCERVSATLDAQLRSGEPEQARCSMQALDGYDAGKLDLQTGLMKLTRAVAQPDFF